MSKADRRARKRENKLQGRAQREAAVKRQKQRSGFIRGAIAVVVIVGGLALILVLGHKSPKKKAATATTTTTVPATTTTTTPLPAGCVGTVPPAPKKETWAAAPKMTIDPNKTYTATMTTTCGTVTMVLDPKEAPKTVNSFVFLAEHHFYDGLKFHRVAKNYVVQGGDPTGTGSGGPGYSLPTEPPKNGYAANSVAMANTGAANSTGSQFFLLWSAAGAKELQNLGGPPYLYSILGHVTKGLDAVARMGSLAPASGDGAPTHPLYMFKVTISES